MTTRRSLWPASAVQAVYRISFAAIAAAAVADTAHSFPAALLVFVVVAIVPVRTRKRKGISPTPMSVREILHSMAPSRWAGLLATLLVGGAALGWWRGWALAAAIVAICFLTVVALLPAAAYDARRASRLT